MNTTADARINAAAVALAAHYDLTISTDYQVDAANALPQAAITELAGGPASIRFRNGAFMDAFIGEKQFRTAAAWMRAL